MISAHEAKMLSESGEKRSKWIRDESTRIIEELGLKIEKRANLGYRILEITESIPYEVWKVIEKRLVEEFGYNIIHDGNNFNVGW